MRLQLSAATVCFVPAAVWSAAVGVNNIANHDPCLVSRIELAVFGTFYEVGVRVALKFGDKTIQKSWVLILKLRRAASGWFGSLPGRASAIRNASVNA